MYTSINIDAAVEHIKNIVDNIRCAVCDKTDGTRMRYSCGHTCCEECVIVAADCSFCLTPPLNAAREPEADKLYTQRVVNDVNLLNVFQNEFHIDVYKRQRISEQLKVEKELFPDCIQAPAKYFNKRKSFKNIKSNKENKLSQIPGEEVSTIWDQKMEQSSGNVEQWLKKYVRKPFADLNSNEEILRRDSSAIKKQNVVLTENATAQKSNRKRTHKKTTLSVVKNQTLIDKHLTPVKKKKVPGNTKKYQIKPFVESSICVRSDTSRYLNTGNNTKATDIDESGIGMEDEAVIIINDSQSIRVDKDENAWRAVLEAENKKQDDCISTVGSKSNELWEQGHNEKAVEAKAEASTKVPFYLKGYLSENCIDCSAINIDKSDTHIVKPDKDVSITVENKSFIAIIKVTSIENTKTKINSKQSVEVQTDIFESEIVNKGSEKLNINLDNNEEFVNQMPTCISQSQDLFNDDGKMHDEVVVNNEIKPVNKTHHVIIEESDSDGDPEPSVSLEVTADIHRSCNEMDYGILVDIENLGEHSKRPRRAARGFTPTSTDSSDKENFNPNRKKKAPSSKKKLMKK